MTADPPVGAPAKAWLDRARQLEATLAGVVEQRDTARGEVAAAVAAARVDLPGKVARGAGEQLSLSGITVVELDPTVHDGVVRHVERWAAPEAHLDPLAERASRALRPLRAALPAASRTAGRLRWAFMGRAAKDEAAAALAAVTDAVGTAVGSGLESACASLIANPPRDPTPVPFAVDPQAVVARTGSALGIPGPTGPPWLLEHHQLTAAREFASLGRAALADRPAIVTEVKTAFRALQDRMMAAQLTELPIRTLREATDGRIRFKALEDAGYRYVADVLRGRDRLSTVHGISEIAAKQVLAAARQLELAVRDDLRFRIDLDRSDRLVTRLIRALHRLLAYDSAFAGQADQVQAGVDFLEPLTYVNPGVRTVALFSPRGDAARLTAEVHRWTDFYRSGVDRLLTTVATRDGGDAGADAAWADFLVKSADYYAALGRIVDLKLDDDAAAGFMPTEIVERVHAQPLDDSFLRVSLRGYQSFGARYALVQRKVILGDEMGLGKTIQSLAVMAHLRAGGSKHFLVVCPASVLINWVREIGAKTTLRAFSVHGLERDGAWRAWQRHGGVAVTTFDTARSLTVPTVDIALLTVDEAHFVKNPTTLRAQQIVRYVKKANRTLFMTGTPLENRVEEFKQLIEYLQPKVAAGLSATDGVGGGRRFRSKVAPVYLRRNTADVLQELPDLVQTEEWEEFSTPERRAYREEVAAGRFMGMRRVAFVASPQTSTKLARLRELADEAAGNDTKVIVFSYFRDVLDVVATALGRQVFGPITGSVTAARRQEILDAFTAASGPAVLVSQIQAGGVGLNMQAGSVVGLCEPQVKPSLEAQAIARAHRMGQVRTVQVHRLLITESVDQRMLEILDSKQQVFDEYARDSAVADISPEAVDVSEKKLAREVVAAEQRRLAQELAAQLAEQYPDEEPEDAVG